MHILYVLEWKNGAMHNYAGQIFNPLSHPVCPANQSGKIQKIGWANKPNRENTECPGYPPSVSCYSEWRNSENWVRK